MFCKNCNTSENVLPTMEYCTVCLQDLITKSQHEISKKDKGEENVVLENVADNDDDDLDTPEAAINSVVDTDVQETTTISKSTICGVLQQPSELQTMTTIRWFLNDSSNRDNHIVRKVEVDPELGKKLKPYQQEGVDFLWRNCFSDFNYSEKGDQSRIGGCILAHYMGLGKSLTTITVLHTALTCRSMVSRESEKKKPLLHTVLMVAPANTLTNWVDEVNKWTFDLNIRLKIMNLGAVTAASRPKSIKEWKRDGGILVLSDSTFLRAVDDIVRAGQPDVLVLDEAHTMLKQSGNKGFKRLLDIRTKRRILLTGTPLQNNVSEYYRMAEYIRPGVIGVDSESDFEKNYRIPIERGLPSDASDKDKLVSIELQSKLKKKLELYVDRKGPDVLRKLLPPIHDNLLELQPSPIQERLIKCEAKARKDTKKSNNFFSHYSDIAPVLNHPGTLKLVRAKRGQKMSWKSEVDAAGEWFMKAGITRREFKKFHLARTSPKLIILAHIVAMALQNSDKILVYSQDLKTLDIVEHFLGQSDWKKQVVSLRSFQEQLGGWEKSKDFLRIDGSVDSSRRGDLVDKFNSSANIKMFLISVLAGGIGINLYTASVVVIMDNHFNPSISSQCISRAHRLGQKKPVYCFRLAMESTMETKIYARSVNKEGVAMQVVDGKFSERLFKAEELNDLQESNTIMTCDLCNKKRLICQDLPSEDGGWTCEMNNDPIYNSCSKPLQAKLEKVRRGPMPILNNHILKHVVSVVNPGTRRTGLVLDYLPVQITHETDLCCKNAINRLKEEISEASQSKRRKEGLPTSSDADTQEKILHQDDSTKKKHKASEGTSQEEITQQDGMINELPLSGNDAEPNPKDSCSENEKDSMKQDASTRRFPDIVSVSSSEEDTKNNQGQPPSCKTVCPNNQKRKRLGEMIVQHHPVNLAQARLHQQHHSYAYPHDLSVHYAHNQGHYSGIPPQNSQIGQHGMAMRNFNTSTMEQQQQQCHSTMGLQPTLCGIDSQHQAMIMTQQQQQQQLQAIMMMQQQQQQHKSGGLPPSNCYYQQPSPPNA